MGLNNVISGPNNIPMYQAPGIPYVKMGTAETGSATSIHFPYVTRDIHITCRSSNVLAVGFTSLGVVSGTYRFTLEDNESVDLSLRIKDLFVMGISGSASYEIVAGLTMINSEQFPILTGSSEFLGVG